MVDDIDNAINIVFSILPCWDIATRITHDCETLHCIAYGLLQHS